MKDVLPSTPDLPLEIHVWLVPSEQVLDQPGSWRIRKWDTESFPEANFTLSKSEPIDEPFAWYRIPPTGVVTVAGANPPRDGNIWSPLYRAPIPKPENRLTKMARIGNTVFGVGVDVHTVALRAQREYENNPMPADKEKQ